MHCIGTIQMGARTVAATLLVMATVQASTSFRVNAYSGSSIQVSNITLITCKHCKTLSTGVSARRPVTDSGMGLLSSTPAQGVTYGQR